MGNINKFRLKVFISSGMAEEAGTKWLNIRNTIKNKLSQCDFIDPFVIEDHVSEVSSTDFFKYHANQTDLIVILINNDIRPGTQQEIEIALKTNKPMLIYFFDSSPDNKKVIQFKESLIQEDKVTFRVVDNNKEIHEEIFTNIVNNVITNYQMSHDPNLRTNKIVDIPNEMLLTDSIINKEVLSYFGNNKDTLIEYFSLFNTHRASGNSEENNAIGNRILEWLINGNTYIESDMSETMLTDLPLPECSIDVFKLRHKALSAYFNQNYKYALEILDEAYKLANETKVPDWILGDILMDCRNIHSNIEVFDNKYQEKINERKSSLYFPLGDRYIKQSFEILEKERFTLNTLSENSVRYGNRILDALQNIENYLYVSFMIGSPTHLLLARKYMAQLFIGFAEVYKDDNFLYQGLRLMTLAGEKKVFKSMIGTYWPNLCDTLSMKAEELWNVTEGKYAVNSKKMKCLMIKSLGQYMGNSLFRMGKVFLLQYSKEFNHHENGKYILQAIDNNFNRIPSDYILDILLNIIESQKMSLFDEVTNLLYRIDLSKCDQVEVNKLDSILKENLETILENNGAPFFIINFMKQDKKQFIELYESIKEMITVDEANYIAVTLGDTMLAKKVLLDNISTLEKRFKTESQGKVYPMYANNPNEVIINMLQDFQSIDLIDCLNDRYIPLIEKVLSSKAVLSVKQTYLESLILIIIEYEKTDQELPAYIKELFVTNKIDLNESLHSLQPSVTSCLYYVNTIKSLLGLDVTDEIFKASTGFNKGTANERNAFAYSLQKYIEYNMILKKDIPEFIIMIVLEMVNDNYFEVRKQAVKCLLFLYNINPSFMLKRELIKVTLDKSPNVKTKFVSLLEQSLIDNGIAKELLQLLLKDASYNVREASENVLERI